MTEVMVLYTEDPQKVLRHFQMMGLNFRAEKHGDGVTHWACEDGTRVLEVYPLPASVPQGSSICHIKFL